MTEPTELSKGAHLQALLGKGLAAANAGDTASAEAAFREANALAPGNPHVLHNLGLLLFNEKRVDEAEEVLVEAARHGALRESLLILSSIFQEKKRYQDAVTCLESVLKNEPHTDGDLLRFKLHLKVAELKGLLNDASGERESYRRAVEAAPSDFYAARKYTDSTMREVKALFPKDEAGAVRLLEQALMEVGGSLPAQSMLLPSLAEYTEWHHRALNGEPPYHANHVDELFFRYGRKYIEQLERVATVLTTAKPDGDEPRISLGIARFCLGDRQGAETLIRAAPKRIAGHVFETAKFAPEFYDELRGFSDDDLTRSLPPLINEVSLPGDKAGIVYLSCNYLYFHAFALPMVTSLAQRSPATPVHLHIMDATPRQVAFVVAYMEKLAPLPFALSIEHPKLTGAPTMEARCYYHAVRFIRFYQHLKSYRSPLWLMDVDAIINKDLGSLMTRLSGHDVAVRVRPGRLEPWNQFNACMVGANTSAASIEYFRLISAYIAYFHRIGGLRWGIDQQAMYGVYMDMKDHGQSPSLGMLGPRDVDYDHSATGYVWPNSGAAKMSHMRRLDTPGTPPPNPPVTEFDVVFERFWQESVRRAATVGVAL